MKRYIYLLLILFSFIFCSASYGQGLIDTRGQDFWITFLPNYHNREFNPLTNYTDSLYIYIVAYDTCSGRIEYRDVQGQTRNYDFKIDNPKEIYKFAIGYRGYELQGYNRSGDFNDDNYNQCEKIAKQSFHLTSTKDITAYAHMQATTTSESLTALPTDALGNEYLVLSYNSDGSLDQFGLTESSTPSQFAVIATEDFTDITIYPSCKTRINKLQTQKITLNKGDVYLVQAEMDFDELTNDLSGSRVTSTKPIALISGHQRATIPYNRAGSSRDCLLEQLPPITAWGRNAIVTPFVQSNTITTQTKDIYRIMASSDNTEIIIDGINVGTFKSGEFFEDDLIEPHFIEANAPILVAQYKKTSKLQNGFGNERSDPLMLIQPPIEQFGNFYRIASMQSYESDDTPPYNQFPVYDEHYINIVCNDSLAGEVMIDGNKIDKSFFQKVQGTQFSYCALGVMAGTHELLAPSGFGLIVYGYGYANSYGYYGGMNLTKYDYRPPQIGADTTCYEINGYITDSTSIDTKLVSIESLPADLKNVDISISNEPFPAPVKYFKGSLINKFEDGSFKLKAVDSTGLFTTRLFEIPGFTVGLQGTKSNDTLITIISDTIPSEIEFCWKIPIENYGKFSHSLTKLYLVNPFGTDTLFNYIPLILKPGEKDTLEICRMFQDTGYYEFRLVIGDSCSERSQLIFKIFALKDKLAPRLLSSQDPCNTVFSLDASEPLKSDVGIKDLIILDEVNGKIEVSDQTSKILKLQFKVTDSRKDAYFKLSIVDSAGNSVDYEKAIPGFTLTFSGNPMDTVSKIFSFGDKMIGTRHLEYLTLFNYGKYNILLENPMMLSNLLFSIPQSQFPMTIPPGESKDISIIYKPISVKKYSVQKDRDTIVFTMNCIDENIPLEGTALEFNVKTNSKCEVPIRFQTDSIPTALEAAIKPTVTGGIIEIELNSPAETELNISIFDQIGYKEQTLFEGVLLEGISRKLFNLENLPNDVYFIQISTSAGSAIMKIVKID